MAQPTREYLPRPIIGIGIVMLKPGSVLLIRRGRPPAEGQWSFPGGAQRLGETAEQAARRELTEETGLACGALHLAGHVDSLHRDDAGELRFHYTILDFCTLWTGGEPEAGSDAKEIAWAELDDLTPFGLAPDFFRIIGSSRAILGC